MTAPNPTPESNSTSSPTPSGTISPAATAPPAEFRFGTDAEPWMQGKTPAEVAQIARELALTAQNALMQRPAYQAPQPQPQPTPIAPDDYVTGAQLQGLVPQFQQALTQQAAQYAEPAIQAAASVAYDRVKEKNSEVFAKYGPEIHGYLAHVPKTQWNIDSLTHVVDLVRGKHVEEIAAERAARLAAQPIDPAFRATGASGTTPAPTPQDPLAGLDDFQRKRLADQKITRETIETFCRAQNPPITVDTWVKRYAQSAIGGN